MTSITTWRQIDALETYFNFSNSKNFPWTWNKFRWKYCNTTSGFTWESLLKMNVLRLCFILCYMKFSDGNDFKSHSSPSFLLPGVIYIFFFSSYSIVRILVKNIIMYLSFILSSYSKGCWCVRNMNRFSNQETDGKKMYKTCFLIPGKA